MSKYTKNDYFAAASAQDLWFFNKRVTVINACRICGAKEECFWEIFNESLGLGEDAPDEILTQIGLELAGL
jgi:hypothetical protein